MTKINLIKILCFLSLGVSGQDRPSGVKIVLQDRLTKVPMANKTVTIAVAPLEAQVIVLDIEGSTFIPAPSGHYNIRAGCDTYLVMEINNIVVGEGKTCNVTMGLLPARKLTRKERKEVGLR